MGIFDKAKEIMNNFWEKDYLLEDQHLEKIKTSTELKDLVVNNVKNQVFEINKNIKLKEILDLAQAGMNYLKPSHIDFPENIRIYIPQKFENKFKKDKEIVQNQIETAINTWGDLIRKYLINTLTKTNVFINFIDEDVNKRVILTIKSSNPSAVTKPPKIGGDKPENVITKVKDPDIEDEKIIITSVASDIKPIESKKPTFTIFHEYNDCQNQYEIYEEKATILFGRAESSHKSNDKSNVFFDIDKVKDKKYFTEKGLDLSKIDKYFYIEPIKDDDEKIHLSRAQMVLIIDKDKILVENLHSKIKINDDTLKKDKKSISENDIIYPHPTKHEHKISFKRNNSKSNIVNILFFKNSKQISEIQVENDRLNILSKSFDTNLKDKVFLDGVFGSEVEDLSINFEVKVSKSKNKNIDTASKNDLIIRNFGNTIILDKEKSYSILPKNKEEKVKEGWSIKITDEIYLSIFVDD